MEETIYSKKQSLLAIFATFIVVNLITINWENLLSDYYWWEYFWEESVPLMIAVFVYAFIVVLRKKTFRSKERIIITAAILLSLLAWPPKYYYYEAYYRSGLTSPITDFIKNVVCTIEIALFALSCIYADRGKKRIAIIAAVGAFLSSLYLAFPFISACLKPSFYNWSTFCQLILYYSRDCSLLLCTVVWLVMVALRNLPEKVRYVCITLATLVCGVIILVCGVMIIRIYNHDEIALRYQYDYSFRRHQYYTWFEDFYPMLQLAIGLLPPLFLSRKEKAMGWTYLEQYKKQLMK